MLSMSSVSLSDARRVIEAGEAKVAELGQPSNIAVVDEGGNLVAHVRMEGAWRGSLDMSINKAFTPARSTSPRRTWPRTPSRVSSSTASTRPTTVG